MSRALLLPLLAGGGWEGVGPCDDAARLAGPHPTPTLPCYTQEKENIALLEGCRCA